MMFLFQRNVLLIGKFSMSKSNENWWHFREI